MGRLVKIHYCKCIIYVVTALSHQRNPDKSNVTYTMKGCVRKRRNTFKDLKVIFDNHFIFDKHISEKSIKHILCWGLLKEISKIFQFNVFLNLYKTIVRPWHMVEYVNQVWFPKRVSDVDRIERAKTGNQNSYTGKSYHMKKESPYFTLS